MSKRTTHWRRLMIQSKKPLIDLVPTRKVKNPITDGFITLPMHEDKLARLAANPKLKQNI